MIIRLTPNEIEEIEARVNPNETFEITESEDLGYYMSLEEIIEKANKLIESNPRLTYRDIDLVSNYRPSYDDILTNLDMCYDRKTTREENIEILKGIKLAEKRKDFEEYQRALEVVKEYEENKQ